MSYRAPMEKSAQFHAKARARRGQYLASEREDGGGGASLPPTGEPLPNPRQDKWLPPDIHVSGSGLCSGP